MSRLRVRFFSFFARHARTPRLIALFWRLAGLHFEGHELRHDCVFDAPGCVHIAEGTFINYGCVFHTSYGMAEISIGRNCDLAPQVMFMCTTHEMGDATRRAGIPLRYESIQVGNGVWIGTRATIMPGVSIGDGAVIGAGALVTRDVPANTVVVGVPAKALRTLD